MNQDPWGHPIVDYLSRGGNLAQLAAVADTVAPAVSNAPVFRGRGAGSEEEAAAATAVALAKAATAAAAGDEDAAAALATNIALDEVTAAEAAGAYKYEEAKVRDLLTHVKVRDLSSGTDSK